MKKLLIVFVLLSLIMGGAFAQSHAEGTGILVDVGLGLVKTEFSVAVPPISAALSYRPGNGTFSFGGCFVYTSLEDTLYMYGLAADWNATITGFGVRFNRHFSTSNTFDPYIGATLGLAVMNVEVNVLDSGGAVIESASESDSGILSGIVFGMRYFFTNNIGIHLELGFTRLEADTTQLASVGLSLKF